MVALSRPYLARPSIVLIDEASMGLSPIMVDRIFTTFRDLAATGVALVIVEQYIHRVLAIADLVVVLDRGAVLFAGTPAEVEGDLTTGGYFGADA